MDKNTSIHYLNSQCASPVSAEQRAEQLEKMDAFHFAFDKANSQLTLQILSLQHADIDVKKVMGLIECCQALETVLQTYDQHSRLFDFYFWLREQLTLISESDKSGKGIELVCHTEIKKLERAINALCVETFNTKVVAIFNAKRVKSASEQQQSAI
ncbi:hypothetical protein HR060_02720 [Catenovulum sp. SM1970]|uniref:hypothetical protein n=1 Tax=Marinifaba aquimaris TaxID=2741323 RepID=UPI001572CB7A|nr:hypothetical protein [Marinifaba aquimaris]NTS75769.1 hypothetical protein [Marinifaba aquimaris]